MLVLMNHMSLKCIYKICKEKKSILKLHYCNSLTWAFLKVNINQHIDFFQNQILRFSIVHSDVVPFETLPMHTRCKKCFITYYKSNGITNMKKHVDIDCFALLKNC
jgi:hypothetical protein